MVVRSRLSAVVRSRLSAYRVFYPAAALYGALVVPFSAFGYAGHAHEMLLGFALAVVAGNQLGPASTSRLVMLFALWLGARVAFLIAPTELFSQVINAAFALALALQVAPRLFAAAKKLRNYALPAILVALAAAAAAWRDIVAIVALFALLMLFMGGRLIPPAIAGQLHRQGEPMPARVQPRLEAALLICGGLAVVLVFLDDSISAMFMAAAGGLAALRLARWRLWRVRGRADLVCLAAGYAWLALGLLALAASLWTGRHEIAAVHVITVGAIGTLTFNVMALSWLLKARRSPSDSRLIVAGTLLIAAATIARVLAAFGAQPWLVAAAACWSAAYALLLALFALNRRPPDARGEATRG